MFRGVRSKKSILIFTIVSVLAIALSTSYLFACGSWGDKSKWNYYNGKNHDQKKNKRERPSAKPSTQPTLKPSTQPTAKPSVQPTTDPTREPQTKPTNEPTQKPTEKPVIQPTQAPSPVDSNFKTTIYQLTSIFENSKTELQYTYCENINDGRGYTFGFAGFCSGTYDGTMFLKEYQRLSPNNRLVKYIPAFEKIDKMPHDGNGTYGSTEGLSGFPSDIAACGSDQNFITAQHNLVDKLYYNASQSAATEVGAKFAITKGELYDSFINHGEDGARDIMRKATQAAGGTPKSGVDEKKWLDSFLKARLAVLKGDSTWQEAVDRVYVYQKLLSEGNVELKRPMTVTCYGDTFTLKP